MVLKLQYIDTYLGKLPPGCSFELVAYTTDRRCGLPAADWVEEQPAAGPGGVELAAPAEIVPVKSCAVEGAFQLQLFAEAAQQQRQ